MSAALVAAAVLAVARVTSPPALDSDAGWPSTPALRLAWNFTSGGPPREATTVRVVADAHDLYVRFVADQHAPVVATQNVNDAGQGSDDEVDVALWPGGANGFKYTFASNPRGTHYQSSSENANYAPTWTSLGTVTPAGYTVTMRIPLRAIRGGGRAPWLAQFWRVTRAGGERDAWTHGEGQSTIDDPAFAGRLEGLAASLPRPAPRLGIYALGQAAGAASGGNTSRTGADLSLPLTATTSLVATVHPDFSNVETDQQSIAPTTFRRSYAEVRPFFAQGASFYDYSNCYGCPGNIQELYTPAIPTPRRGYQLEGKQGGFTFGVLDALGDGRSDNAQSLMYATADKRFTWNYTRVASEQSALHDVVDYGSLGFNNHRGLIGYAEAGFEHGSMVTQGAQARRLDAGLAYMTRDDMWSFTMRHVGSQYQPADGFVSVNDIAGYSAQGGHTWHPGGNGAFESLGASVFADHYAGSDGFGANAADFVVNASVFLKNKLSAGASVGSGWYRVPGDPTLHPANQQGARLDYLFNTALQSTLMYNAGAFGDGWLSSAQAQGSVKVARRLTFTLSAYETAFRGAGRTRDVQWLDRASATFDLGARASLVAGVRTLKGTPPPFPGQGRPPAVNQTNLSFGLAARRAHDDVYLVYGDAGALTTQPALTLKLVHYFGAEKGT